MSVITEAMLSMAILVDGHEGPRAMVPYSNSRHRMPMNGKNNNTRRGEPQEADDESPEHWLDAILYTYVKTPRLTVRSRTNSEEQPPLTAPFHFPST